ncbi:transcriptional regulator [Asanoa ferruginea]|nr:transcriptional regulator [Asanoa ferruginea]
MAKAAEVLGDRWTLLLVRDLLFGPLGFNELARGLPGISRSVLSSRLRHLERLGLIELAGAGAGYQLTGPGRQLSGVVRALGEWAVHWVMEDPAQAELDPDLLILWISRHVAADALPAHKTVVAFRLSGPKPGRLWMVLERTGVSICHTDPGLDPASYVHLDGYVAALYGVYSGRCELNAQIAAGRLALAGDPALVRAFPSWFTWSSFATTVRAAARSAA